MWGFIIPVFLITSVLYYGIMWLTARHDRNNADSMFDWSE